ncbi:MAG: thymidine phosphorylase [Planctomycetaceae bacterium]
MSAVDIIRCKRDGGRLTAGQISEFISGVLDGEWQEGQVAALLMAIVLVGLDEDESDHLLTTMVETGECFDAAGFQRPTADKHSTGGVGDKTSLVVAPLAAACGIDVPMLSGRGLGHTGGTLDKLQAIPDFRVDLGSDEIRNVVAAVGCVICGATERIAPADRVLYRLRDATATVDSVPLICASILSKKLAEGISALVLDVKCGSGAVFAEREQSETLAHELVARGEAAGLATVALLTGMSTPLGLTVGNGLEVAEAVACLKGKGPDDLRELCLALVTEMIVGVGFEASAPVARRRAEKALASGHGLERLSRMVSAQGGDATVIDDTSRLPGTSHRRPIGSPEEGTIVRLDARILGRVANLLGAGRRSGQERIDPGAGIRILRPLGSTVREGETVMELLAADDELISRAEAIAVSAIGVSGEPHVPEPLILGTIGANSVREEQA